MPWENKTVEDKRKEFVDAAGQTKNFSQLCREYGITRKTGYKWVERWSDGEGLSDKSRRPLSHPNRTPIEVEERILQLRAENVLTLLYTMLLLTQGAVLRMLFRAGDAAEAACCE